MRSDSRQESSSVYSSSPWWYDLRGFFILTFAYNSTLTHQLRFFGPNVGRHHLEVAVGTGTLFEMVLRWRRWKGMAADVDVVAIDCAESMLAGAKRRFGKWRNIEVRHADAAALPYPDASFATANIANAAHCFPDLSGALREVFRVLEPGGTLAANVLLYPRGVPPFRQIAEHIDAWGMRKGLLHTPYRQDEVREHVAAAGFSIVSVIISGNCCDVMARKPAHTPNHRTGERGTQKRI